MLFSKVLVSLEAELIDKFAFHRWSILTGKAMEGKMLPWLHRKQAVWVKLFYMEGWISILPFSHIWRDGLQSPHKLRSQCKPTWAACLPKNCSEVFKTHKFTNNIQLFSPWRENGLKWLVIVSQCAFSHKSFSATTGLGQKCVRAYTAKSILVIYYFWFSLKSLCWFNNTSVKLSWLEQVYAYLLFLKWYKIFWQTLL